MKKTMWLQVRAGLEELTRWRKRAAVESLNLSQWVRRVLDRESRKKS